MLAFWNGFEKRAALRKSVELEPHQTRAGKKLDQSGGLLVYHGLGSGKTLTSLAATQGHQTDVVVPAALRGNYQKEVEKHTTGHKPNIMSYEKSVKTPPGGDALVVDEAHNLGDVSSKRTQSMLSKAPAYDKRMLLTGTPIKNYPYEIAPLMKIVRGDNAIPTDPATFNERFVEEVQHQPGFFAKLMHGAKPGVSYRIKNPEKFKSLTEGYVDYHAPGTEHYPSVSHEIVEAPMDKEQLGYYNFVLGQAGPALRWKIRQGLPPSKQEAKQLNTFLTGVRQVSNSTKAFGGQGVSPKVGRALEELQKRHDEDPRFKGLVYSNFLDSGVKSYAAELEKRGIPHAVFSGELSDRERKQIVESYNADKIKALLISGAGAHGLDLKGTKLVQLLEPHWQNVRLEQAIGRAARYKSHEHLPENERHVHVQRFHSTIPQGMIGKLMGAKRDKSVDEYLSMLAGEKEKLNNQFLDVLKRVGQQDAPGQAKAAFFRGFEKAGEAPVIDDWIAEDKEETEKVRNKPPMRFSPRELSEWQGLDNYSRGGWR